MNREIKKDLEFPPIDPLDERLTQLLYSFGPGSSVAGFGLSAISWPELKAWVELTKEKVSPWQADALFQMSRAYCSAFTAAAKEETQPPWGTEEVLEKRKASSADALKSGFRSLMKQQKKRG